MRDMTASCIGVNREVDWLTNTILVSMRRKEMIWRMFLEERREKRGRYEKSTNGKLLLGGDEREKILSQKLYNTSTLPIKHIYFVKKMITIKENKIIINEILTLWRRRDLRNKIMNESFNRKGRE